MTSRGAIQQRIALLSSEAQTALATRRLFVEWEIKTSCAMPGGFSRCYLLRDRRYFFAGMYLQCRALPSASHLIDVANLSWRVSSRFASVTHSR